MLQDKLTILVCSCDKYEDLWTPFFTLLKKYWDTDGIKIILNTETKGFSFDGLDIQCVHTEKAMSYGARMLNALSHIRTKYVLALLDDFFIRSTVDNARLEQIINWMEADSDIVYFNCDINKTYIDWEVDKYPGFRRIPPGNDYILSMQAAIWRTNQLKKHWRPDVTPWEWELLCNVLPSKRADLKYYCVTDLKYSFIDYGYNPDGMGVFRGKWVIEDVKPLFEREGIMVDYTKRGIYNASEPHQIISNAEDRKSRYSRIYRCLGWQDVLKYFLFLKWCKVKRILGMPVPHYNYFKHLQDRAKVNFLKKSKH